MKRSYTIGIISVAVLAAIFCAVLYVTQSLWFLRGILGEAPGNIEVGYTNASTVAPIAARYIGSDTSSFQRIVFVQDNDMKYVVALPSPVHVVDGYTVLQRDGWTLQRIGWVLVGSKSIHGSVEDISTVSISRKPSIFNALVYESKILWKYQAPWNPVVVVRIAKGIYGIDSGIAAYAAAPDQGLMHATVSFADSYARQSTRTAPRVSNSNYDLFLSIQSNVLHYSNNQITQGLQQLLGSKLGFTASSPNILATIPDGGSVIIAQRGGNSALGVDGHGDQFSLAMVHLASVEQGDRHPERRAFALPDGTISHEYIPTSPVITFSTDSGQAPCQKASGYDESLFLCAHDGAAIMSSHEDLARVVLSDANAIFGKNKNTNSGYVSSDIIKKIIPEVNIGQLQFVGDDTSIDMWAKMK